MKINNFFSAKKYKILLFFPLAAIAISYLIGAVDISYMFNIPMIMSPVQAGMPMQMHMPMQMKQPFSKINPLHRDKLNLQSYITCVECQNLPTVYRPKLLYYGIIIKTASFAEKIYVKHLSSDIPHPPQNLFI